MFTYSPAQRFVRGPVGFALVSLLHVLFIYLIATGLMRQGKAPEDPVASVSLVFEKSPPPTTEPVPEPRTDDPEPWVRPPPETPLVVDESEPDVIAVPLPPPTGDTTSTGSTMTELPLVAPRIDPRSGLSQPEYPAAAIRQGWEGRVLLRLTVGENGRVLAAELVRSSGHAVLDEAAIRAALRDWRLLPARRGTAAVEGIFSTWVRFSLADR
jgi:protein TonB